MKQISRFQLPATAQQFLVATGLALLASLPTYSFAAEGEEAAQQRQTDRRELLRELDRSTQIIKERALDLEHALYKLELDAKMHPLSETRLFFAVQTKKNYTVQQLRILVDGRPLIDSDYHKTQAAALREGGAERIFHGNIPPGEHKIEAYVEGYFKEDGKILAYNAASSFNLDKSRGLTHLLLALDDTKRTWEPTLRLQVWQ